MRHFNQTIAVIILFSLVLASLMFPLWHAHPVYALSAQLESAFQPTPCMFPLPAGAVEGTDIVCGYLTVPAEHANPDGPTIQIAVAIIKSQDPSPQPDPLFLAQGGPGGSTIDTYVGPLFSGSILRANRDIVLFDQRGTLYSKPALYCTEIDELTADTLEKVLTRDEGEQLNLEAMAACRERLAEEGINLSAFDSLENAADIESLRQALGYEKINLYGVSYGTLLALHYMRNFPSSLRSVILDGVVPPQTNFILGSGKTMDQSFSRLFQTCQQDEACNSQYPDLEKVLFDLVVQLNQSPARISMTDPETGTVYEEATIDGDTFLSNIFQFLYISDVIPALPRMIYDASKGDFEVFARILSIIVFDRSMSYGMYYSVVCAEDSDFTPADHDLSGVRPIIAEMEQRTPHSLLDLCKVWDVQPLDAAVDQAVQSNTPTLVLSGGFDPITPPQYAEAVASNLSNSYNYVFPTGAHGQMLDGGCSDAMILSFLDDPTTAPDSSCIDLQATPDFLTSRNTIDLPVMLKLLNLDAGATLGFIAIGLFLLLLWTSVIVFPLAWLIERSRRKLAPETIVVDSDYASPQQYSDNYIQQPQVKRPGAFLRLSSWFPVLASGTLSLFLLAFLVFTVIMVTNNEFRLFYGLSGAARPWFILVQIFVLMSLLMFIAAVLAWVHHYGAIWRRLYYTLLTLAALIIVGVLASWGMLTAIV